MLVGGVSLLDDNALLDAELHNPLDLPVETSVVDTAQHFQKALQVTSGTLNSHWWAVQASLPTTQSIAEGDVLLASFYVRGVATQSASGKAYVRTLFQGAGPPWDKSLLVQWSVGKRWRKISCPFVSVGSYDKSEAMFTFAFNSGMQTIQIGGVVLTNFGKNIAVKDLPRSRITYHGRHAKAAWRDEANARIDTFRKADLEIVVRHPDGTPIPGASIEASMTRHAFPFGTAVAVHGTHGPRFGHAYGDYHAFTAKDDEAYDYWLKRWFTKLTPEVALMTNGWTGHWRNLGREVAINGVNHYRKMGFDIRGHILVWPGWKWFHLPGIEAVKDNPEKLGPMVIDHVKDQAGALKDTVFEWTLLNEPFSNHDLMDILGNEAMVDWFEAGREAAPDAKLYINDYSILSGGGLDHGHQDHYAETIEYLLDRGAPLDGIGLQSHFADDVTPPERVYEILNRFAAYGKEMQITEFDINSGDATLQADYTRDFLTVCFSHPAVCGFSLWGFWERAHWRPAAALIDKDWKLRPNGKAFDKLVRGEWWTDERGTTRADGTFGLRGFQGEYKVTVQVGSQEREYSLALPPGGATLDVVWSDAERSEERMAAKQPVH